VLPNMNDDLLPFVRPSDMDDAELRRELAETHQLAEALSAHIAADLRATVQRRCAELDAEYLHRYPSARATWPWPTGALSPQPA
jgi:hypothetical protein